MADLYKALVALPSKSFGLLSGAVGITAAFWPSWFEDRVGARMSVETIQTIGFCLMAASIAYFALLWRLKPSVGGTPDGLSVSLVSSGSRSPIVTGDNNHVGHNYINAPHKFTTTTVISTGPDHDLLAQFIDLGGLARLRLFMPYSETMVTMIGSGAHTGIRQRYPAAELIAEKYDSVKVLKCLGFVQCAYLAAPKITCDANGARSRVRVSVDGQGRRPCRQ